MSVMRSYGAILIANLLTPFNILLGALLGITLVIGPFQDAAFGVILLFNLAIGTFQEFRAKWTLDHLAILVAPSVVVMRSGEPRSVASSEVLVDDLMILAAGDQIVADAIVLTSDGLEINEALITGESEAVTKAEGDALLAGSFAVAGGGRARVTAVGESAYGQRLAAEARQAARVKSELVRGTNLLLITIGMAMLPLAPLIIFSQLRANSGVDAVRSSIAGLVTLVPQGLVLLTSIAFAAGTIRLARRKVVVSELAAIEPLARVDTLCIDKTGTLTTGNLTVAGVDYLADKNDVDTALLTLAGLEVQSGNAVAAALRQWLHSKVAANTTIKVPFSSSRRWSGVTLAGGGTWLLGAPESLSTGAGPAADAYVAARLERGQRVLLLGHTDAELTNRPGDHLASAAVIGFEEEMREGVQEALRFLTDSGVTIKVLSGDNPRTVASVAARAGIDGYACPIDASCFDDPDCHIEDDLDRRSVFGRISPQGKRRAIHALQRSGHVVAMAGDGINDVLALRDADLGLVLGAGTSASRGVAKMVLTDGTLHSFSAIVGEGRRALANVERVASLFVSKTVYACILILFAAGAQLPFPLLLRNLTAVDAAVIGIPAFILALPRNTTRWRSGFLRRILGFALPAGVIIGVATALAYETALNDMGESLMAARSIASLVLGACALWLVYIVARRNLVLARLLVVAMAALLALTAGLPAARSFFGFSIPSDEAMLMALAVAAIAIMAMEAGWRLAIRLVQNPEPQAT